MDGFMLLAQAGPGGGGGGGLWFIIGILAFVVIFFLCREVMCWYWKINRIIELLEVIANKSASSRDT